MSKKLFIKGALGVFMALLVVAPLYAINSSKFTQPYEDGLIYEPNRVTRPTVIYADMDGDKIDEMVVAMQMLPMDNPDDQDNLIDEEHSSKGWYRAFAYVYRTDGGGNPTVLLRTLPIGELLGARIDDDHEKIMDAVDLNNYDRKAVAIWSTSGMHYHGLIIIGMSNGKVISLFNGGSNNQLIYEPSRNKNKICAGDIEWSEESGDTGTWREDVWKWNGKEFVYSRDNSILTSIPS